MKKLFVISALLLCCCLACKKKQGDVIAEARKTYEKVNKEQKDLTKREVDDISSREKGNITGYYKDEEIKKMSVQHFGDKSRTFTEYYFEDGMLVYMLRQEFVYNKPTTYTQEVATAAGDSVWYDDRKTTLQTSIYYFNDNKLIKWKAAGDKDMAVNTPEFIEKEPMLLAEALLAMKQLKEDQK